ncbi:hypothetical protein BDN70DRAFT_869784 [Pholiota conissans]|uniref:DUF6593 domain-containing protein n=1 Tax=Pholiota conissans TaxID=109636 RepID=A0A9P5ZFU6_9AGAR|nr:hypothetical protein BDN70DRAFT_869784 [Pholiota conissans]
MIVLNDGTASESKQSLPLNGLGLPLGGRLRAREDSLGETSSVSNMSSLGKPPPRYLEEHPKTQITYDFVPQSNPPNSMIMCPPNYLRSHYPSYHISVTMNVFTPFSYITTVRRDNSNGEVVGEFEMGISGLRRPHTICLRGYECPIDEMLEVNTKMFRGGTTYLWRSKKDESIPKSDVDFCWEEASFATTSALQCFLGRDKTVVNLLAKFMPSTLPRRPGRPVSLTRMDVTPKGHDFLDEIVMSVLIVERMRTSPSALKDLPTSMLKELF